MYSSDISMEQVINIASQMHAELRNEEDYPLTNQEKTNKHSGVSVLFHAAQIIQSELKMCNGLDINPIDSASINLEQVLRMIPENVYRFLKWVLQGDDGDEHFEDDGPMVTTQNKTIHQHILSLGQDLIHLVSKGSKRTPKDVGLAMSIRHMTGCKQLVTMVNKSGHCHLCEL